MKFDNNLLKKRWVSYTVALCIAVAFYLALSHINLFFVALDKFAGFARPVVAGIIIAYVLDPLIKVFEKYVFRGIAKKSLRRNLSVLCGCVGIIVAIVVLIVALIPQLVNSILTLFNNLETYATGIQNLLNRLESETSGWTIDVSSILESGESLIDRLIDLLPQNLDSIFKTTVSVGQNVFNLVIGCILAIYFLVDKERLLNWFARLFRLIMIEKTYKSSAVFWSRCHHILIRYIICDLLDGAIVGLANALFMTIMGIPYAAVVSFAVGVFNLAPTFGPIIGGAFGALILVLVNPWYALWFLLFTVAIQTLDGYVIKPKLFGSSLGVSGVWILICIVVGGRMFGVAGILLAIPFAAISDFIYDEYVVVKLSERKARREASASAERAAANPERIANESEELNGMESDEEPGGMKNGEEPGEMESSEELNGMENGEKTDSVEKDEPVVSTEDEV